MDKTVDGKDAVVERTGMYLQRVLSFMFWLRNPWHISRVQGSSE
jgi:hypothetical protein